MLIEPQRAVAYEALIQPPPVADPRHKTDPTPVPDGSDDSDDQTGGSKDPDPDATGVKGGGKVRPKRYYGTVELDPVRASLQFSTLVNELVSHFTARPGAHVRIKVDIEAEHGNGFDEATVRTVRENGSMLGVKPSEFE